MKQPNFVIVEYMHVWWLLYDERHFMSESEKDYVGENDAKTVKLLDCFFSLLSIAQIYPTEEDAHKDMLRCVKMFWR